jgi:hypothetical protein
MNKKTDLESILEYAFLVYGKEEVEEALKKKLQGAKVEENQLKLDLKFEEER